MKTLTEKAKSRAIEKIDDKWYPIGQKILKSKYKEITTQEFEGTIDSEILTRIIVGSHNSGKDLKYYINSIIPERVMEEIRKAKGIGFKKFRVVEKKNDPVIIAIFCGASYFIAQW